MRIGTATAFLEIEPTSRFEKIGVFKVRAEISDSSSQFLCAHEAILFETTSEIRERLARFRALELHSIELPATEGGWLRLQRSTRGQITCRVRIVRAKLGAASETEVLIDGEFGDRFCGELAEVIFLDDNARG